LLPLLSRQLREGALEDARNSMNRGMEVALLLTVPAAAALLVIAGPIITALFERGEFGAATATATAQTLMAYAIGLPAYVLIKVLGPGFYAREDTVTPAKIAIVCVAVNVILSLTLIHYLAHVGIALATAISAWLNAFLLASILHKRGHHRFDDRLRSRIVRILFASAAMAAGLWLALVAIGSAFEAAIPTKIAAIAALVVGGLGLYAVLAIMTGAVALSDLKRLLSRKG
jgi:putative peptidoglycan lipid II flippase